MKITKEITLDVSRLNRFQSIIAKQNDKDSRYLKVSVADEGNVLIIPSSAKVTITATRPDKLSSSFLGKISEDGKAIVPLSPWMLELDGSLSCEVSIISEESVLKTTSFFVDVEPDEASGNTDVTQDPNYDILVELIQEVAGVAAVEKEAISTAVDAYLHEKNIRPLQRGVDYWTPSDKAEIIAELSQVEAPTIVQTLDDMTDTSRHYVLEGNVWAYMLHKKTIPESNYNVFSYDTNNGARINTRLSREGSESTTNGAKGSFITNYIELPKWGESATYNMYINFKLQSITLSATTAVFYDENKNVVGNVVGYEGSNTDNITTTDTSSVFDLKRDAQQTGGVVNIPNAKYVRVQLFKKESGTALTTSDLAGVEIMLEANKTPASTVKEYGWTDTGISYAPTFKTDLIGVLVENNVIYLSDNALPSGTYTLKYGDETYDTIGTLTVV